MHVNKAVTEWKTYRTRFLIKAKQLTETSSFVDPLGREHQGRPGDYLVESSDGVRLIAGKERSVVGIGGPALGIAARDDDLIRQAAESL